MRCAEAIRRHGGDALGIPCDVTDERQVEAMVARAREVGGGVDVLVNNAGILGGQSVLEMELERWNRQLAVNLTGTFLCTKHVARLMIEHSTRGSIIVVVSTAGHQGQAGNIGYCTSKSGLLNFTRAAAMDLVRHGIRVNSLTPTATDVEEGDARAVDWGRPRPERRGRVLDFAKMLPMDHLPSPRQLRAGRGVPGLRRRRDDHGRRPARGRRGRRARQVKPGHEYQRSCSIARRRRLMRSQGCQRPASVSLTLPGTRG